MSPFPYRTVSVQNWCGVVRGTATKLVRCIDKRFKFVWYGTQREPYRTKTGTVRIAVRFAVLNNKRITVSILVRYGSRSNTKMRTVKINGSVRFALPIVRLKNGTVTVAIAVKNGTVKKTENGTDTVRCGTDTVRCQIRTHYCIILLLIKKLIINYDFVRLPSL